MEILAVVPKIDGGCTTHRNYQLETVLTEFADVSLLMCSILGRTNLVARDIGVKDKRLPRKENGLQSPPVY